MSQFKAPDHITVGTSETSVVPELLAGVFQRIYMKVVNVNTASSVTFHLYRYDSASSETAGATTSLLYNRLLPANSEEVIDLSVSLGPGWVITASASTASSIIIHLDTIQV